MQWRLQVYWIHWACHAVENGKGRPWFLLTKVINVYDNLFCVCLVHLKSEKSKYFSRNGHSGWSDIDFLEDVTFKSVKFSLLYNLVVYESVLLVFEWVVWIMILVWVHVTYSQSKDYFVLTFFLCEHKGVAASISIYIAFREVRVELGRVVSSLE